MQLLHAGLLVLLLLFVGCSNCGIIVEEQAQVPIGYKRLTPGNAVGGSLYKLHRRPRAWEEARAACEEEGAHLLVLESNAEAAAVRRWLRRQSLAVDRQRTFTLHAGFHVRFLTVLGQPLSPSVLERWRPDEPSSNICGQIDEEVWMLYAVCSTWAPFICEYPIDHSSISRATESTSAIPATTVTVPPCARLPGDGYERAPGWLLSLYKLHPPLTWPEANRTCAEEGAHLAVVDSEGEVEALIDFLRGRELASFEKLVFIGARTHEPVTVFGTPLNESGYDRWLRERQHDWECLTIDRRMLFLSRQCSNPNDQYNFLCEKDIS